MPTTTIETPLRDVQFERRVAKKLGFWWLRQGIDLRNVLTKFIALSGDHTYSGPLPMSGQRDQPARPFALVSCELSHERAASMKREYVSVVRATLAPEIPADRVFVSFYPTHPANHYPPDSTASNGH